MALLQWKSLSVTQNPLKYADRVMIFICILIDLPLSLSGLIAFPIESCNPIFSGLFWLCGGGGDGHCIDCNSIVSEFGISQHLPFLKHFSVTMGSMK